MSGRRFYDLMYRAGLARTFWSQIDRPEIRHLVEGGPCDPKRMAPLSGGVPRTIDLGCGEGVVSIYLARQGFDTVGVDFSRAALELARRAAERAGTNGNPRFVEADLTAPSIIGIDGPFDLLVDYGTLDDLAPAQRRWAAALIDSLARPGSRFFLYTFYARRQDLPFFSLSGPSRLAPEVLEPGEVVDLFGRRWEIERLARSEPDFVANFLLTGR